MKFALFYIPIIAVVATVSLAGCSSSESAESSRLSVVRLAVTTSTRDSGLLDELVPFFERQSDARVDVIAVGTGAALKLGEARDVDVVLVHARDAEEAFMAAGFGRRREDVMFNMFVILGPVEDPAKVGSLDPVSALREIANGEHRFVSRGDDSGTHKRELQLWADVGSRPDWRDFVESGQGMGATLMMADEMNAYVLVDRGTYLKFKDKIRLVPLGQSSESLRNSYGAIVVNADGAADRFVDFLISKETQQRIRDYKLHGEQLFQPMHLED